MNKIDSKRLQLVLSEIAERNPKPTELLEILASQLSYTEIQDAVGQLLDTGIAELSADRHLRAVRSAAELRPASRA